MMRTLFTSSLSSTASAMNTWAARRMALKALLVGSALSAFAAVPQAHASILSLTPDGVADGFTLSQFAYLNTGYENDFGFGPFGVAYAGSGNVIVSNYANNTMYSFKNIDGQTAASALNTIAGGGTSTVGMASLGNVAYGANVGGGGFAAFNSDGTVNHALTDVTTGPYLGMAGDPARHSIIASSGAGLIEIDPAANGGLGSFRVIADVFPDGVSVSADGKTAFLEDGGHIVGYDIATGATVLTSPNINGLDGTGVVSGGAFDGDIVANSNDGFVELYDPNTNGLTIIASGGSRGDYAMNDPSTGTLFLDYSEGVYRLSCGNDCSIGGGGPVGPSTPELSTWAMMSFGFAGMGFVAYRTRKARGVSAIA